MSIEVVVHEAKGLNNLQGRIKARVTISESRGGYGSANTIDEQTSRSVEEYSNVTFDDAQFTL